MDTIGETVSKIIEDAMNHYPWDAGYRIDFYRAVAAAIVELADALEEDADSLGYLED